MEYALAPNVTYCVAGGRYFFLDLHADRYTCLSERAQGAFIRLEAEQAPDPADVDVLEVLASKGILSHSRDGRALAPCKHPAAARRSIHRRTGDQVPALAAIKALANLHWSRRSLARKGLEAQLKSFRDAKEKSRDILHFDLDRVGKIARSYELAGLAFTLQDNCLLWTLALAKSVISSCSDVNVVLAVMARPFMAHSWAQIGDTILNDEVERTEQFTPILVI